MYVVIYNSQQVSPPIVKNSWYASKKHILRFLCRFCILSDWIGMAKNLKINGRKNYEGKASTHPYCMSKETRVFHLFQCWVGILSFLHDNKRASTCLHKLQNQFNSILCLLMGMITDDPSRPRKSKACVAKSYKTIKKI